MTQQLLTVSEVAARLALKESTIRAWLLARRLIGVRVGRRAVRIPVSEVERIIAEGTLPRDDRRASHRHSSVAAGLLLLLSLVVPGVGSAQGTTISATGISDKNGNPYTGTITPIQVVATGQPQTFYSPVALNSVGAFSAIVQSNVSYVFTVCSGPVQLGPTANPTPRQVCFTTPTPILVSGTSLDITAQLQAAASVSPIFGPQIGSITSIGLSMPAEFNVSGSPVTGSSGTLTVTKANQSANTVYAGPASGSAAAPGFRAHVPADFPAGSNCGANNFANGIGAALAPNCAQPSFSNLSGSIAVGQTPLTTLGDLLYVNSAPALARLAGNTGTAKNFLTQTGTGAASAAPSWNTIAGTDVPAINLAASGNGGVTGTLPVADLTAGSSGQCVNTSGTSVVWGSCAGTAGVQVPSGGINTTSVTVNAAVTTLQGLMTFSFASGALNTSAKSFRVWAFGNANAVNTTETVSFELLINGSGGLVASFTPATSGIGLNWSLSATCTVTATGATGSVFCSADWDNTVGGTGPGGGAGILVTAASTNYGSVNLTGALSVQPAVSFTTASASNTAAHRVTW